jgi:hypothetical protein
MFARMLTLILFSALSTTAAAATQTIEIKAGLGLWTCKHFGTGNSVACMITDTTYTPGTLTKISVQLEKPDWSDMWESKQPVELVLFKGNQRFYGKIQVSRWKDEFYRFQIFVGTPGRDETTQPDSWIQNVKDLKNLPFVQIPGLPAEKVNGGWSTPILFIASADYPF